MINRTHSITLAFIKNIPIENTSNLIYDYVTTPPIKHDSNKSSVNL